MTLLAFVELFQPWICFWIIRNLVHRWIVRNSTKKIAYVRRWYIRLIFRCNLESFLNNVYIRITCLIIIQWYLIQQISNFPLSENNILCLYRKNFWYITSDISKNAIHAFNTMTSLMFLLFIFQFSFYPKYFWNSKYILWIICSVLIMILLGILS